MPFKSEKQRRYLWANEPEIARDWTDTYGSRIKKNDGGITQLVKSGPGRPGYGGPHETEKAGKSYERATAPGGEGAGAWQQQALQQHRKQQQIRGKGPEQVAAEKRAVKAKKKAAKKKKSFFKDQLKARTDQAYNWTTMTLNAKKRALADAKEFLNYRKSQGDDVSELEEIFTMDPKNWSAEQFNTIMGRQGGPDFATNQVSPGHPSGDYIPNRDDFTMDYSNWQLAEKQKPGIAISGNLGNVYRMKNPKGAINPDTGKPFSNLEWDKFRDEVVRDRGYETGREGPVWRQQGYSSEADYLTSTRGGGGTGGGTTAAATTTTPSAFQQSLTTGASSPFDYYVGQDPTAENLAWGEKFGVDPRTMYKTSWADGGRIGRAYGGIMDTDTGRRAYGFGSFFKKVGRAAKKVFKSPIGKAALLAGAGYLMTPGAAGMGSFNPAGKGAWWKNLMMGKLARAPGLPNQQMTRQGGLFSKLGGLFKGGGDYTSKQWNPWKIGIGAAAALPFFMGGDDDDEDDKFDYMGAKNAYRDEMMRIKAGALAGTLDPTKFRYQGVKDGGRIGMYAGGQSTPSDYTMEDAMMTTTQDKLGGITDVMKQADLNRQGSVGQFYAAHGGSADDNNARLEARVKELQDEGLDYNSAMAQAMKELSSGKAQGGRIGYAGGSGGPPITLGQNIQAPGRTPPPPQRPHPMPAPQPNKMGGMPGGMNPMMNPMMGGMHPMMNRPMMNPMGGRRMAQEGGLMDLGGMEKDYRNDGGFVPLGGEEKADDVPARLSKNEFVFTADAVRGAGDGDIDKGAEIMENIMKNLEQGGQISEETQGLTGAQEMFGVSERLGEVL